jgi:hypothetical protein
MTRDQRIGWCDNCTDANKNSVRRIRRHEAERPSQGGAATQHRFYRAA